MKYFLSVLLLILPLTAFCEEDVQFITTDLSPLYDDLDLKCHTMDQFFGFQCPTLDFRSFDSEARKADVLKSLRKKFGATARLATPDELRERFSTTLNLQLNYVLKFELRGREERIRPLQETLSHYLTSISKDSSHADAVLIDQFGSWGHHLNAATFYLVYLREGLLIKIDHGQ